MEYLAKSFLRHFRVGLAVTPQEKRTTYAIRHQVYAEELGWEPQNESRLETDSNDENAYHCLLEHKQSGDIAGCVRLVLPPPDNPESPLPCQTHGISLRSCRQFSDFTEEALGEISRLAVLSKYRAQEAGKPFPLNGQTSTTTFPDEEQCNLPNISIGLCLSAIALVELCELDRVLVMMEHRLQRHLQRIGLLFHQLSETFEHRGRRALFELSSEELTAHMDAQVQELYHCIRHELRAQLDVVPQLHFEAVQHNDPV